MDTKICPFCGETIMASAKKCRYCAEWLETPQAPAPAPAATAPAQAVQVAPAAAAPVTVTVPVPAPQSAPVAQPGSEEDVEQEEKDEKDLILDYEGSYKLKIFGYIMNGLGFVGIAFFFIATVGYFYDESEDDGIWDSLFAVPDVLMPIVAIAILFCLKTIFKKAEADEQLQPWFIAAIVFEVWNLIEAVTDIEFGTFLTVIDWIIFIAIFIVLGIGVVRYKGLGNLSATLVLYPLLMGVCEWLLTTDWIDYIVISKGKIEGIPLSLLVGSAIPFGWFYLTLEFRKLCTKLADNEVLDDEDDEEEDDDDDDDYSIALRYDD